MRLRWRTPRVDSLTLAKIHKNWECTSSPQENFRFSFMWLLYVQLLRGQDRHWHVWATMINLPELPIKAKLEMMHILQAQVCGCISAYLRLPHQKMKRETSDTSKSQLNQPSCKGQFWNLAQKIMKSSIMIFQSFCYYFPLIARSEKVTSLSVWLGVSRTLRV